MSVAIVARSTHCSVLTVLAELPNQDRSPPPRGDSLPIPNLSTCHAREIFCDATRRKKVVSSPASRKEHGSCSLTAPPLCMSSTQAPSRQRKTTTTITAISSHNYDYHHHASPQTLDLSTLSLSTYSNSHAIGFFHSHNTHLQRCSFPRSLTSDTSPRAALLLIYSRFQIISLAFGKDGQGWRRPDMEHSGLDL